jgi:hypothetical protein
MHGKRPWSDAFRIGRSQALVLPAITCEVSISGNFGPIAAWEKNTFNYPTLAEACKIAGLDAWTRMTR